MKVVNLKVNHVKNPVGYDVNPLTLSWQVNGVGLSKKYARVKVASDEKFQNIIFDSGNDESIDGVCYGLKLNLTPRTKYYVSVSVVASNDEQSEAFACFETGKMDEKWKAKWIKAPFKETPYISKKITVDNTDNARVYMVGRGAYEIYCNGEKVGEDYLSPGHNSYDLWEQIHTYDISKYLNKGDNVIGITIGDGWYRGRLGWGKDCEAIYGDELMVLAEIHFDDKIIGSDRTWKCSKSPITFTNVYDGEIFDARLDDENWSMVNCDFDKWQNVYESDEEINKLADRMRIDVKKHETFKAEIIETPKGEIVLDFGQNIAGWVEGDIDLPNGKYIKLQHGEILQDECFYNENLRSAKAEYIYISNGEKAHFRPRFTFFGFRYVKVSGDISKEDVKDFTAYAVYSDMEQTGFMKTENDLVNKLISNILWGQKGNFLDVPTDCPQRDERLGWTGDAQIFAATASYNMDTYAFYKKYMKDLMCEQKCLNGGVPFIIPYIKNEKDCLSLRKHSSCAWGDVATVLPWTMYQYFGDKELLAEHYIAMKSWTDFIKNKDEENGGHRLWQTGFHFADWLALDNYKEPKSSLGGTDTYYVASMWYAYSTLLTSKAANVLGLKDDKDYYEKLYSEIKTAILNEYFTSTGRCSIATQTAKVLALQMGIVDGDFKKRTEFDLVKQLKENEMKLETGFCGTPFLCTSLTNAGFSKEAYTLLLREELPGWLYEVLMGATTVWERWNSVMPDGKMNPLGMNSLNHYAYGAIKEWMYKDVCGIRLADDGFGFKSVEIAPKPDERLGGASCKFNSAAGIYESSWKIQNGKITYKFVIPFDATANIKIINKEAFTVSSGVYTYEFDY